MALLYAKFFEDHFGSAGCRNKYWPFSNEKKRLSLLLFFLSRIRIIAESIDIKKYWRNENFQLSVEREVK